MLPTNSSELNREGEFYLGYETATFTITPVTVTFHSLSRFALKLESAVEEGDKVLALVGIISSYYYYYFV